MRRSEPLEGDGLIDWIRFRWRALRKFMLDAPKITAVYSDGKRIQVSAFRWSLFGDRPPHLLVKLECDGVVYWELKP